MTEPRPITGGPDELVALRHRLEQLERQNAELRAACRRLESARPTTGAGGDALSGATADPRDRSLAEERYDRLLDTAADFIFIHPHAEMAADIRFSTVNDEACRRLGYSREELQELGPLDVTDPEDAGAAEPDNQELGATGELLFERTLIARDGARIPVEIRSRRFRENGREMVISVARDISARKQVRDSLDALINAQSDSALLMTPGGRILAANEAVARRFGYASGEDLLGLDAYELVGPEVAASRRVHVRRAIEAKVPVTFRDERVGRIMDNTVQPVLDRSGAVTSLAILGRDVTEQVTRRQELEQHERRQRLLLDSLPALVNYTGRDGRYRQVNARHEEVFGRTAEEMIGLHTAELIGEQRYARVRPHIERVLAGEPQAFVLDFPFDDGAHHWLDVRYVPDIENGEVVGFYVLILDISDSILAQRRLAASESQLELFFAQVPVAIVMGGADGVLTRANPAAEEFFGRGQGGLVDVPFADVSHPDDLASDLAAFGRVVRGETRSYAMQKRFLRPDGTVVWGELTVSAATEERDLFFGIIKDITPQKQEEEARRDQELERQRLLTAIEQSEEAVVITDVHACIQYVNGAFERTTGYTAAEVRGQNPRLLQSGEHDADFYAVMWATLTAGESWTGRMVNRRKDGSRFVELATISPVRDQAGNIMHFVAVKRDITHELELEEQMRQSQKMEALGKLAGGIAHDFNNVLYALMGNTELALGKVAADGEVAGHLRASLTACRRAGDLVRQILAFSRRHERRRAVQDPVAMTRDVLGLLRPTLPATVDLVSELAPDCPPVEIDRTEWHQIVMNLATNAVQALPEGKGRVEIRAESASMPGDADDRATAPPGPAVRLTVRDTGAGMPAEVVARCCEPYFTTKPAGVGTGMGLSIVHGIVTSLGGSLDVLSRPGAGTSVLVSLPAARQRPAAASASAGAAATERSSLALSSRDAAPGSRPPTIMVVEDEEAILELATTALERQAYAVRPFQDPQEALAAFCDDPAAIDLVVTDQTMPELTGLDLAREMIAIRGDLPVIICSGYSATFREDDARALGVRAYLPKPVPLAELVAAVGRELGVTGPA